MEALLSALVQGTGAAVTAGPVRPHRLHDDGSGGAATLQVPGHLRSSAFIGSSTAGSRFDFCVHLIAPLRRCAFALQAG